MPSLLEFFCLTKWGTENNVSRPLFGPQIHQKCNLKNAFLILLPPLLVATGLNQLGTDARDLESSEPFGILAIQ